MTALFPAHGARELFWQRVEVHAREAESSGDACGHMSPDFELSPVGFFLVIDGFVKACLWFGSLMNRMARSKCCNGRERDSGNSHLKLATG